MPPEAIATAATICTVTAAVWALGFHYGVRSFKNRNKAFLAEMKRFNENRNPQSAWFKGYQEGGADMLGALERFLDQFKADNDETA